MLLVGLSFRVDICSLCQTKAAPTLTMTALFLDLFHFNVSMGCATKLTLPQRTLFSLKFSIYMQFYVYAILPYVYIPYNLTHTSSVRLTTAYCYEQAAPAYVADKIVSYKQFLWRRNDRSCRDDGNASVHCQYRLSTSHSMLSVSTLLRHLR